MKKIHWFHLTVILFITFGFIATLTAEESVATVILNFFLGMFTFSYLVATIWEGLVKK